VKEKRQVAVLGEPGSGKTTCLQEAARYLAVHALWMRIGVSILFLSIVGGLCWKNSLTWVALFLWFVKTSRTDKSFPPRGVWQPIDS
jgi:MoxR-like ATPase